MLNIKGLRKMVTIQTFTFDGNYKKQIKDLLFDGSAQTNLVMIKLVYFLGIPDLTLAAEVYINKYGIQSQ